MLFFFFFFKFPTQQNKKGNTIRFKSDKNHAKMIKYLEKIHGKLPIKNVYKKDVKHVPFRRLVG